MVKRHDFLYRDLTTSRSVCRRANDTIGTFADDIKDLILSACTNGGVSFELECGQSEGVTYRH